MMGAKSFNDYKQFAYGFWRGQHGTTLYPPDNPFVPQKAEDRVPTSWVTKHNPSKETIKQARTKAFHPPNLNIAPGSESPTIDALTSQMQNLELYQHESSNQNGNKSQENSLESLLRRLIQEETRKINEPRFRYNDNLNRYNRNQYRNNYQLYNNGGRYYENQECNAEPKYNGRTFRNKREEEISPRNRYEEARPYRNNNNIQHRENILPSRPNSPSATLAYLETDYPSNEAFIFQDEPGYAEYENMESREYVDADIEEELYAVPQIKGKRPPRQLKPWNEKGKVVKQNIKKKVEFNEPTNSKNIKQKQATTPQANHMSTQEQGESSKTKFSQPESHVNTINNAQNPQSSATSNTGITSTFGQSAFTSQQTPN
ncbi:hypothetical protein INT45_011891 [Circinella minor]|uniref:Uncharacterized protein n=1 Tax=Circinella minor TaxID=1195481 RepID=A0A8H7RQF3_9FUNG|nr:hypothetical protein INT45_011891 [Circinella minor]